MSKKKIIILIIALILVGIIVLGIYLLLNKKSNVPKDSTTPWYQSFSPFGTGNNNVPNNTTPNTTNNKTPVTPVVKTSKFFQITDFAIAGATFLEDTRPIVNANGNIQKQEPIKTIIPADTKEGRKEIQTILNITLSLKPPLVVDGNFGKLATAAIKSFQKLNNLPTTGIIDTLTAPYFTKTTDRTQLKLDEQVPSVRYVERMNGHIYKMFLDTKVKEEISNSTIPSIYEAFFNNRANTVIYRYLSSDEIVNSFMATLGAPKGEFLPQSISDLSVSLDKTKFFYLAENNNGVTGAVGTFGETKRDVVFNYPFTEWLSSWDGNHRVYLTTKASYGVNGSIFLLDTTNKTILKIFGGVPGLTTLINPKGSIILYGTSINTGPELGIFDIAKHSTKDFGYGLPEKCVWSNDNINIYCAIPNVVIGNQYPDSWYQGLVSFDDYFVKINTITGDKTIIANSINETAVDGTYLFLSKAEDLLFFTNKKDSTFWGLDLK
jgi:peptidoglycan hydrolase-like protein with peptidoglycan-binding domain